MLQELEFYHYSPGPSQVHRRLIIELHGTPADTIKHKAIEYLDNNLQLYASQNLTLSLKAKI